MPNYPNEQGIMIRFKYHFTKEEEGDEMTSKTHVLGGMVFGVGGYLYTQALGMTITDVTPVLQLGMILPYAVWSSTLPDLDQDNSEVAAQSPFNLVIQKFFNAIKAGHRSARSHIYPMLISFVAYLILLRIMVGGNIRDAESVMSGLIVQGIFLGLFSHFVLDIMTEAGVQLGKKRIRIVPKVQTFGTGTPYEDLVRKILYILLCGLFIMVFV